MRNMDMIYFRYKLEDQIYKILQWGVFLICSASIIGGVAYVVHLRMEIRDIQVKIQETDKRLLEYRKKLVENPGTPRSSRPTYLVGNVRLYTPEEAREHIKMIHRK